MLLHTSDVCYTESVSLYDGSLKGSSSPCGFDDGYLRKDIQCKTLHIARFNPIRKSSPSIKAAAKAHKTNSIIFPLAIIGLCFSSIQFAMSSPSAWLLTPETNEQCAALPKSHCYFASTYCLSSAPPFRLFGGIPKTPCAGLLRHDDCSKV
jgi:hypothetical protein